MNLRQLQYFLLVCETGSLSKAAHRAHVSQAALSIAIQKLETTLGAKLLDRGAKGVTPTIFGRSLLDSTRQIFRDVTQAQESLAYLKDPRNGRVALGLGETVSSGLVMTVISGLLEDFPGFQVDIRVGSYQQHYHALITREVDVIVSQLPRNSTDPLVAHEPLVDDRFGFIVRHAHPLATRRKVAPKDLLGFPWLGGGPLDDVLPGWSRKFRARGLSPPRATIGVEGVHFVKSALPFGDFIAVLPEGFVAAELEEGTFVALTVDGMSWPQTKGISYRRHGTMTPAAQLFIERLRAHGAKR